MPVAAAECPDCRRKAPDFTVHRRQADFRPGFSIALSSSDAPTCSTAVRWRRWQHQSAGRRLRWRDWANSAAVASMFVGGDGSRY